MKSFNQMIWERECRERSKRKNQQKILLLGIKGVAIGQAMIQTLKDGKTRSFVEVS